MYDLLLPTSIKELKNIFAWNLVLNRSKTLRKSFCEKFLWLWNMFLIKFFFVENFLNQIFSVKILWLWKIYLMKYFAENFLDQIFCAKFLISIFFWKITSTVEKCFDQGKLCGLWKNSLIKETFFECGKLTSLTAKNNEIVKTSIFNTEHKLCWLSFFVVD